MTIHVGSKLRVNLTFEDELPDGTTEPINLGSVVETVRIVKPDGTELAGPHTIVVVSAAAGTAYWETPTAATLDQAGTWKVQGVADGYKSAVASFLVSRNP